MSASEHAPTAPAAAAPEPGYGAGSASRLDEDVLLAALRAGDERAFAELIRRHHASMLRLAQGYVRSHASAEEVVQETWEAVLRSLDRFEGRSALKTWIFRIVINRAKTRGALERRTVPASCLGSEQDSSPTVDPARFQGPDGEYPDHWAQPPRPWQDPERRLASLEVRERLRVALERLPERQRLVVGLRDVDGLSSEEVCGLLGIEAINQRVLLHRGRAALREALDEVV